MKNKQSLREEFLRWFKREGSKDYPNYIPEIVDWFEGKFSERLQGIKDKVKGKADGFADILVTDVLQIIDEEIEK